MTLPEPFFEAILAFSRLRTSGSKCAGSSTSTSRWRSGPKRAVEHGVPDLAGWLEFQGGLAQYHNAHPSLRQMDAGR
jgi:hypothetical protein